MTNLKETLNLLSIIKHWRLWLGSKHFHKNFNFYSFKIIYPVLIDLKFSMKSFLSIHFLFLSEKRIHSKLKRILSILIQFPLSYLCKWWFSFTNIKVWFLCLIASYQPSVILSVLSMTLNCIWWQGSSSGDMESMKYSFIAITLRSILILVVPVRVPYNGSNWSV